MKPENFRSEYEKLIQKNRQAEQLQESGSVLSHPLIANRETPEFEEYVRSKTDGHKLIVSDTAWEKLATEMEATKISPELTARRFGFNNKKFIFRPQDQPFNEIENFPSDPVNISINNGHKWLRIYSAYAQDIYGLPSDFLYPYRYAGIVLVVLSFLTYGLIPHNKFAADEIHYPRGAAVIGPDLIGLLMTATFFLLPFLIVWDMGGGTSIFSISKGWVWLTAGMWLMASICLLFLRIGLNYSNLCYRITKDGFHEVHGGRDVFFPWNEIDYYQSYKTRIASKLATLLILFGNSFQTIGLGLALDGREEYGINIFHRNGDKIKVMANSLENFEDIIRSMKERGITRKRKQAPR